MPLCFCDHEVPLDQKFCGNCGREQSASNSLNSGATTVNQVQAHEEAKPVYSAESMREVKAEAKERNHLGSVTDISSKRKAKSRTRVEKFNRLGFVLAAILGVIAYFLYRDHPKDIHPVLYVCAPIAVYFLWLAIYHSSTVKCPACADSKKKRTTSKNPRKLKRRAFVGTHHRGYQDGWRTKTQSNTSNTSYQNQYGQHVGDSQTTSYSSYVVPTRTEYLSDEFHCPDCGFVWLVDYTKTWDLA